MTHVSIMTAALVSGCILVFALSLLFTMRAWPIVRNSGTDAAVSMVLSFMALVPGSALALEYFARLLYADWMGTKPTAPEQLVMVIPAALWLVVGPILFLVSLTLLPLRKSSTGVSVARVGHVLAWMLTGYATVLSLVSI